MDTQVLSHASSRLKDIHSTLHLIYHRNKNQHRNSKWWKWLSLLKRSIIKLINDIEEIDSNIDVYGESRIKARTTHFRSHVVPRCYMAFSTVVADNQFSTLGVVLVALLARISKALRGEEEKQPASSGSVDTLVHSYHQAGVHDGEDTGEIVGRRAHTGGFSPPLVPVTQPETENNHAVGARNESKTMQVPEKTAPKATKENKKKKKKKKEKGNEIDDIFNSLF